MPVGVATMTPSAAYVVNAEPLIDDVEADEVARLLPLLEHRLVQRELAADRARPSVNTTSSIMRSETAKSPASSRGSAGSSSSGSTSVR